MGRYSSRFQSASPRWAVLVGILINNSRMGDMNSRMGDMNSRLGDMNSRLGDMNSRLDDLRSHMDARFDGLKDMWRSDAASCRRSAGRATEAFGRALSHLFELPICK